MSNSLNMNYETLQNIICIEDSKDLKNYNVKRHSKYYLHQSIGPCPYEGNFDEARVILLLANPSYSNDSLEEDHRRKPCQDGWGIFSLHDDANPAMRDWWITNLNKLRLDTGLTWKTISNRVAALQINPWASVSFDSECTKLPSINGTMKNIAKAFIQKKNVIFVICRRENQWKLTLADAGNRHDIIRLNSFRRAYITPGNLSRSNRGYEKIINLLTI